METRQEKAARLFQSGYNCSQSVFAAYCDYYGMDEEIALKVSASFGGGMGRMREVCGAVSGMFMVAGLETGTADGKDVAGKQHNYEVVQQLANEFKAISGSIICKELLGLEPKKEYTDTKPQERNSEYYKKRPCTQLVQDAVEIIEKHFMKQEK